MAAEEQVLSAGGIGMSETEQERVATLVHQHARFVYRVAYSVLRNREDAEDTAQEVFLKILRYPSNLSDVIDERAWLAKVAWRTALTRTRSRRHYGDWDAIELLTEAQSNEANPEQQVGKQQVLDLLDRMILSLPDDLRAPMQLSTVEDISAAEIAQVLDIPEASVRTRLFRARALLREKFSKVMGGRNARQI